jgi:hypothetical protein
VEPAANKPAKSIADLTCALATGMLYSIPLIFSPGLMASGIYLVSSLPIIWQPIIDSGFTSLAIGLFRKEASPVTTLKNGWQARMPVNNLKVVPEFPASRISLGSFRP